jgi:hypothetical protein
LERLGEQINGFSAGSTPIATLQRTNSLHAQVGALGEFLLGQTYR